MIYDIKYLISYNMQDHKIINRIINCYTGFIYSMLGLIYICLSIKSVDFAQKIYYTQITYTIIGFYYTYLSTI